ncbi:MAG TPA: hypothetical protein DCQ31_11225 [Bacteroidales bacterium]|nr:hypothetical protein [Bacteroidales bacterium]
MSKKVKNDSTEHSIELVEGALNRSERYIEQNQKSLSIIVLAIVVIIGGYLAYDRFYVGTQEDKAQSQMFVAERYFEQDSFNLALNGDGSFPGFLGVIEDYSVTNAANLSHYYAGICYLHLGEYDKAIDFLQTYETSSAIIAPMAFGAIGDAYSQKGELKDAVSYYEKASSYKENEFTTPLFLFKAGLTYELLANKEKALAAYNKIKKEFPESTEGRTIDKYIGALEAAM